VKKNQANCGLNPDPKDCRSLQNELQTEYSGPGSKVGFKNFF
jgi:hypothetical protein